MSEATLPDLLNEKQKFVATRDRFNIGALPKSSTCSRQKHTSKQRAAQQHRRYWPCSVLGGGAYGDVYLCWDAVMRTHVAIKQFISHSETDLPTSTFRELAILKRCAHAHIVPVIDTLTDELTKHDFGNKYVCGFVMPYCSGGDAHHWLKQQRKIYDSQVADSDAQKWRNWVLHFAAPLSRQLYMAIEYLHKKLILHRDIKPQNCLIDGRTGRLLLSDMGLGRQCSLPLARTYSGACCTLWYRPPELLLGTLSYGLEVDIWAAGCTVAEFCCRKGSPLVSGVDEIDQIWQIYTLMGSPTDSTWPNIATMPAFSAATMPCFSKKSLGDNLLKRMPYIDGETLEFIQLTLKYAPIERMSAKDALQHAFLARASKIVQSIAPFIVNESEANGRKISTEIHSSSSSSSISSVTRSKRKKTENLKKNAKRKTVAPVAVYATPVRRKVVLFSRK